MKYDLLKQVLASLDAFEQNTTDPTRQTLPAFTAWLNQQADLTHTNEFSDPDNLLSQAGSPDTLINVLIAFLYRYARLYSKKVLEHSPLTTLDDFSYLIMLLDGPPPTKTELIERNIHEKTTGTEIIRRLLTSGLVEQIDHETDRRAKRIQLTERGKGVLFSIMPQMGQVATLVGGNLTLPEKMQLVFLLNKLHAFHNPIYLNEHGKALGELMAHVNQLNPGN